jgi:hypothetical protein
MRQRALALARDFAGRAKPDCLDLNCYEPCDSPMNEIEFHPMEEMLPSSCAYTGSRSEP